MKHYKNASSNSGNMEKRREAINRPLCRIFLFVLVSSLAMLSGCGQKTEKAEEALERALLALTEGEGQDVPLLGADGTPVTGFENQGLAREICVQLSWEIKEVSEEDGEAEIVVEIAAPDMPSIVREVLDGMEEYDQELFQERMKEALQDGPPSVSFTVELRMRYEDDTWYLIPDAQLGNAITGGLLRDYADQVQRIREDLGGGE